jgi:hypothetical protein
MDPGIAKRSLLVLASAAAATGIAAAFGAWLIASPSLAFCGAALLLSSPALAVVATSVPSGQLLSDSDFALREAVDHFEQVERSLRFTRGARSIALIALSYAVVLSICQSTGLIAARGFVIAYSLMSMIAVVVYLPWLRRRESSTLELRATLRLALGEFKARRNWDAG